MEEEFQVLGHNKDNEGGLWRLRKERKQITPCRLQEGTRLSTGQDEFILACPEFHFRSADLWDNQSSSPFFSKANKFVAICYGSHRKPMWLRSSHSPWSQTTFRKWNLSQIRVWKGHKGLDSEGDAEERRWNEALTDSGQTKRESLKNEEQQKEKQKVESAKSFVMECNLFREPEKLRKRKSEGQTFKRILKSREESRRRDSTPCCLRSWRRKEAL